MNKRKAIGILGLGATSLLALGLYKPSSGPANNYGKTPEIVYEDIVSNKKPIISEELRRNMKKARELYSRGVFELMEEDKPKTFQDLEDSVETCLDELPDFKIVCLNAHGIFEKIPLPILIDTGNEETPIATQDEINRFIQDAEIMDRLIEESVCNPRRKQKLYDFLKIVQESRKKFGDPSYMEAIGLNAGNWRRAEECIEKTSKFFAYKISETIHEYLKTDLDLKEDIILARDALLELKNLMEASDVDPRDLKSEFEDIMEGLSSGSNDNDAYEVIREFDYEGIHTIRYLTRTGVEKPERAQEMFDFIEKNKGNTLHLDLQAEVSLEVFIDSLRDSLSDSHKNDRLADIKRARELIEEINDRKNEGYD